MTLSSQDDLLNKKSNSQIQLTLNTYPYSKLWQRGGRFAEIWIVIKQIIVIING